MGANFVIRQQHLSQQVTISWFCVILKHVAKKEKKKRAWLRERHFHSPWSDRRLKRRLLKLCSFYLLFDLFCTQNLEKTE